MLDVPVSFFFENAPGLGPHDVALHPPVRQFLISPEALRLLTAFFRIEDKTMRAHILNLVQVVADQG